MRREERKGREGDKASRARGSTCGASWSDLRVFNRKPPSVVPSDMAAKTLKTTSSERLPVMEVHSSATSG